MASPTYSTDGLSTSDRLPSEGGVLSIIHHLDENICQVVVHPTEEWGKLESSQPPGS